jgi:hypothetical protein
MFSIESLLNGMTRVFRIRLLATMKRTSAGQERLARSVPKYSLSSLE